MLHLILFLDPFHHVPINGPCHEKGPLSIIGYGSILFIETGLSIMFAETGLSEN